MANLLAALLTFGHLSETNELTGGFAPAIATWRFLQVPVTVAILVVIFLIPFNTSWAPQAHAQFRAIYLQLLQKKSVDS